MKSFLLLIPLVGAVAAFAATDASLTVIDQARAALQKGDLAGAETWLVPLATAARPDAAACHQLGLVRQRQSRTTEAIALLEKATQLDATQPGYFSDLGVALGQRMGEITFVQQALLAGKLKRAFAKSVELDPNHLPGLIGLCRFYTRAPEIAGGSPEKAKALAERVRALDPFLGELELAGLAEYTEAWTEAFAHYDAASQLRPDHVWAHVSAARMLAKLGRQDEARTRLQRALELDPKREATKKALAALDAPSP